MRTATSRQFTEWPGPLRWVPFLSKPLIHLMPPPFSLKTLSSFSLKSSVCHKMGEAKGDRSLLSCFGHLSVNICVTVLVTVLLLPFCFPPFLAKWKLLRHTDPKSQNSDPNLVWECPTLAREGAHADGVILFEEISIEAPYSSAIFPHLPIVNDFLRCWLSQTLTLQLLFWNKARETPKKTRVFLFPKPLKCLEKKGKTAPKSKEYRKKSKEIEQTKNKEKGSGLRKWLKAIENYWEVLKMTESDWNWLRKSLKLPKQASEIPHGSIVAHVCGDPLSRHIPQNPGVFQV